jgi:hypothetical protein
MHPLHVALLMASLSFSSSANANCSLLHASDALPPQGKPASPAQSLNEAYPQVLPNGVPPWKNADFKTNPQQYAEIIRQIAKTSITIESSKVRIDNRVWWTVPFMNYTNSGREHYNGLTRERTPHAGDLSPQSTADSQVWAVGWYNAVGAYQFGRIWHDQCQPDESLARLFSEGTLSVKMLFTTADSTTVPNLDGSPEVQAAVDPSPQAGPPTSRVADLVRLLQVDFAVKDDRSSQTGWVFGTFAWTAPRLGDGLWDSLQLVGLHWGNDPGKMADLQEGWVNASLQGKLYGWPARPFMGFLGRINGPADNLSSACLSCHSRAQLPRARGALAGNLPDLSNVAAVQAHLAKYFQNIPAGTLEDPAANAIPLDYSLQVMNAFEHQCAACAVGDVSGNAPNVCKLVKGTENLSRCAGGAMEAFRNFTANPTLRTLIEGPPDRQ